MNTNYRTSILRAFIGSIGVFFVFSFAFYAFHALALSNLSESLKQEPVSSDSDSAKTDGEEDGGSAPAEARQLAGKDLVVLVDGSGSMSGDFGGISKIDAAKASLVQAIDDLAGKNEVRIYSVGSNFSSQDKERSCTDFQFASQEAEQTSSQLRASLGKVQANGNAPIAYGISQLKQSFATNSGDHTILLIADGADNCDGDVLAEARDLLSAYPTTSFYIMGLDVEPQTAREYQQIAEESNGQYFPVSDQNGLTSAVLNASDKVQKSTGVGTGEAVEVTAGDSLDAAKIFGEDDFGKTFTLENHLDADEYEYWRIDLKPGQGAKISIKTAQKDVQFTDGNPTETDDAPSAGVVIFDEKQEEIFDISVQQSKGTPKTGEIYSVSADDDLHTYYLAVGYSLAVHKDMEYSVELVEQYDEPNQNSDAANSIRAQLANLKQGTQGGYLSGNDLVDYFNVEIGNGQKVTIGLTPEDAQSKATLELYDGSRNEIEVKKAEAFGEEVLIEYEASEDDTLIVAVKDIDGLYALDLLTEGERIVEDEDVAPIISTNGEDLINVDYEPEQSLFDNPFVFWGAIVGVALVLFAIIGAVAFMLVRRGRSTQQGVPKASTSAPPVVQPVQVQDASGQGSEDQGDSSSLTNQQ